jgi:hypothetical protein
MLPRGTRNEQSKHKSMFRTPQIVVMLILALEQVFFPSSYVGRNTVDMSDEAGRHTRLIAR